MFSIANQAEGVLVPLVEEKSANGWKYFEIKS
jgi:hypothetical protein